MNSPNRSLMPPLSNLAQPERLKALAASGLMDEAPLPSLDRYTRLAHRSLAVSSASFCVVGDSQVIFKSHCGDDGFWEALEPLCYQIVKSSESRSLSGCPNTGHALMGYPVQDSHGHVLGALCVADRGPRVWTECECECLFDLCQGLETELHLKEELTLRREIGSKLREAQLNLKEMEYARERLTPLRALVKATPQSVAVLDHHLCYLAYSDRWLSDFKLSRRTLIGVCHFDVFPESPESWRTHYQRALEGTSFRSSEDCFVHSDGRREWVNWEVHPWHRCDGSVGGVLVLNEVLTGEKERQEELSASLSALETVRKELARNNRVLAETQRLARVTRWSWDWVNDAVVCHHDGAQILMGLDEQRFESLGDFLWSVCQEDRRAFEETLKQAKEGESAVSTEFALRVRGQKKSNLYLEAVVRRGVNGEALGLVGSIQDVTPQRLLEQQVRNSQKAEALGSMAGGIAHDFNNILCAILGFADLTSYKLKLGEPVSDELDELKQAAKQAEKLVQQLLFFSRKKSLRPEVLSLPEVLRGCQKVLGHILTEDVALDVRIEDDLPCVDIDRSGLEQLILNSVDNARDAMSGGGEVAVSVEQVLVAQQRMCATGKRLAPGRYVRLRVQDSGAGMDQKTLRKIFDPCFSTKGAGTGSGLGLSVCMSIVEQAGGAIDVHSVLGQGTDFQIFLPAVSKAETRRPSVCREGSLQKLGGRIVLVEDDPTVQALADRLLSHFGFKVKLFGDPLKALDWILAGHEVMLLMTDIVLPKMDGLRLAELMQKERPEVEVLYLSGYSLESLEEKNVLPPVDKLLRKPFTTEELESKLVEVLL